MGIDEEIARYLGTGDHDMTFAAWPGGWFKNRGAEDLKAALVAEVQRRTQGLGVPNRVPDIDLAAFTRRRIEGMVHGLFPKAEWAIVLPVLERSVVFLTPASIATILAEQRWLRTAWDLANMYLASVDTDVLGPDAEGAVGLSEETTCYVTMDYFDEDERFADYVVHEVAHIFHNCKRETIGLPHTRRREWLLDIEFRQRETFAYACEAYSRLVELAARPAARRELLDELLERHVPSDARLDRDRYVEVLREAVEARNGWKQILSGCSPRRDRAPRSSDDNRRSASVR